MATTIEVADVKSKTLGDEFRAKLADKATLAKMSEADRAQLDKLVAATVQLAKAHPGKGKGKIQIDQGKRGEIQVQIIDGVYATGAVAISAPPPPAAGA